MSFLSFFFFKKKNLYSFLEWFWKTDFEESTITMVKMKRKKKANFSIFLMHVFLNPVHWTEM